MENKKKSNENTIYVGIPSNVCMICGCYIPEGREVCPICEDKILNNE